MTLTPRDRKALILGGIILACLVGYRLALSPMIASWQDARQRTAVASMAKANFESEARMLTTQRRQLEPIYGDSVAAPLPGADDARASFVKTVENIVKSNGMSSQGVRSQPLIALREVPGVALVALQVQCTGKPLQLMKCLAGLRRAEQLILVKSLHASPDARRPDQISVTMVLATPARMSPRAERRTAP